MATQPGCMSDRVGILKDEFEHAAHCAGSGAEAPGQATQVSGGRGLAPHWTSDNEGH